MALVTKQFEKLAETTAKGKGMPDLKMIVLPFPYDQLPEEKIRELARQWAGEAVEALAPKMKQPVEARPPGR